MGRIRHLIAAACAALLTGAGASGQPGQPYVDSYPVEALARVLGELHALDFACQGRQAQAWRDTMLELLEHEAPTRGGYRDRLIEGFNAGFQTRQRERIRCGAEAEMVERSLAARGRSLSEQLRLEYLE